MVIRVHSWMIPALMFYPRMNTKKHEWGWTLKLSAPGVPEWFTCMLAGRFARGDRQAAAGLHVAGRPSAAQRRPGRPAASVNPGRLIVHRYDDFRVQVLRQLQDFGPAPGCTPPAGRGPGARPPAATPPPGGWVRGVTMSPRWHTLTLSIHYGIGHVALRLGAGPPSATSLRPRAGHAGIFRTRPVNQTPWASPLTSSRLLWFRMGVADGNDGCRPVYRVAGRRIGEKGR